ncbi:MAG: glycosyltransferase family 9 protein [bacterium]
MKKILVIQIKQIGDCILTEPVFPALKNAFPGCRTCFVVGSHFSPLFQGNPFIDEVIPYDFNKPVKMLQKFFLKKFDIIFDFLGNPRSRMLTVFTRAPLKVGFKKRGSFFFYNLRAERPSGVEYAAATKFRLLEAAGVREKPGIPKIYLSEKEIEKFSEFAGGTEGTKIVAVSPTSRRPARRWRKEYFAELADRFVLRGLKVIFVWGPGEENYIRDIVSMMKEKPVVAPPTDLRELAALICNCDLLVSNCNGTRHISVASGTPTLTVHGPTHWKSWKPPDEKHEVIFSGVPCLFCGKRECEDMRCMEQLKPVTVEKAAVEMLKV